MFNAFGIKREKKKDFHNFFFYFSKPFMINVSQGQTRFKKTPNQPTNHSQVFCFFFFCQQQHSDLMNEFSKEKKSVPKHNVRPRRRNVA